MRAPSRLAIAVLLLLLPLALTAQARGGGGSTAGTGGTSGRATGQGPRGDAPTTPPLPNPRAVGNGLNPADHLAEKHRKLKLADSTVTALRALAGTMTERYAPALARYDSLRTHVNMARSQTTAAMGPTEEERQISRERMIVLARTMSELRTQRAKDVVDALALLPEDKRAEGQAILDEQAEDLMRAFRRSGGEGAAAAGGPPGRRVPFIP